MPMPEVPPCTSRVSPAFTSAGRDIGPDGEKGFRDRGRLDCREPGRDRQGVGLVGDAEIGVAAAGNERSHSLAQTVKRGVRPERRHLAGDFEAEDVSDAGRGG